MNEVFFTTEVGLTSTSANYFCNLAKEILKQEESKLNELKFYQDNISLIGNNSKSIMSHGIKDLKIIMKSLQKIYSLNSFVAWLREAIKEKDILSNESHILNTLDPLTLKGYVPCEAPVEKKLITDDDIIKSFSETERARYLALETKAAVIGKYIHPGGSISNARNELLKIIETPIDANVNGANTVIIEHEPTVDSNSVESLYLKLQEEYREAEKELNSIKFTIKEKAAHLNRVNLNEFKELYNNYIQIKKNNETLLNKYVIDEIERISKLKIIIPKRFETVFNELNNINKKAK